MRCKNCDYRLWNISSRQCPECGQEFKPSEFEFLANSVQYCCPHCAQPYYGTGPRGHLVPRSFDCAKCHRHIDMDDMVLLPTEGVPEDYTQADDMPWLKRGRRGVFKSYVTTVGSALVNPARLINTVPASSSLATALWFAFITQVLVSVVGLVPTFGLSFGLGLAVATGVGGPGAGPGMVMVGLWLAAVVLGAIAFYMLWLVLWALAAHAMLRISGPTAGTLRRTFHALCYSSGANIISAIPWCGMYVGWLWWAISGVVMIKHSQRVHGFRALLAVLVVPVMMIVGIIVLMVWMMNLAATTAAASMGTPQTNTQTVVDGLLFYADDHDGDFPKHALELVAKDYVFWNAMWPNPITSSTTVSGSVTNVRISFQPPKVKRARVQAAIKKLPANVIAHRLGDFVFTYHGIDQENADDALWLVVHLPASGTDSAGQPISSIFVALLDGTVEEIPIAEVPVRLAEQNDLRAHCGLPPLPDLATVTEKSPAAAEDPDAGAEQGGAPD